MPPHCDTLDGPVVTAARRALEMNEVDLVLPYVHESGESEVRPASDRASGARGAGRSADDLADLYFFENVVRIHRAGEGATYTGVKPAGLSEGPVIPLSGRAVESGSTSEVFAFLAEELQGELTARLENVKALAVGAEASVPAARAHVEALLNFEVFTHTMFLAMHAGPHGDGTSGHHAPGH